jgi:RNA polymerase sigma-70 factor (ECF subfamily)
MNTTSLSLLDRLKRAGPTGEDWRLLHDLYLPLIRYWLSRVPGAGEDADDLAQEVLVVLVRELPGFEHRRHGSFRAWLRQVTVNQVRSYWKRRRNQPRVGLGAEGEQLLAQLEDPHSDLSRQWDQDHDQHVLQRLLTVVQGDFEPRTWQAFTRVALDGLSAAAVARELNLSESAVAQARFRVLKRLREEAGDLLS